MIGPWTELTMLLDDGNAPGVQVRTIDGEVIEGHAVQLEDGWVKVRLFDGRHAGRDVWVSKAAIATWFVVSDPTPGG